MKVTNKQLSVLAGLAVVLLAVTILVYAHKSSASGGFVKDTPLIQGLDPQSVWQIKVRAEGKEATLQRHVDPQHRIDEFQVVQRDNYVASTKQINQLLNKVLDITCADKVSDSAESHKDLGVAETAPKCTLVDLLGKDGKSIATLLVGSVAKGGGNYVRLATSNTVYTSSEGLWGISGDPISYLSTKLTDVPKDDILLVTVKDKSGQYMIAPGKEPQLQNVPAGKRARQTEVDAVFGAITDLTFDDVTLDGKGLAWDATYTGALKNHLSYVVQLGKRDSKVYATVQAVGPSEDEYAKSQTISRDEPKAELDRKDAILKAHDAAVAFNAAHNGWIYQVSEYKAKNFTRPLADLVEAIPPATKPATTAPATTTVPAKK